MENNNSTRGTDDGSGNSSLIIINNNNNDNDGSSTTSTSDIAALTTTIICPSPRKGILKRNGLTSTSRNLLGVSLNVDPTDYIITEENEDLVEDELENDDDEIQDEIQGSFDDATFAHLPPDIEDDIKPLVDNAMIPPSDKYWIVYIAFYILGLTTLLPWYFFINADKYWMYKFRDVNQTTDTNNTNQSLFLISSSTFSSSGSSSSPHGKTEFQAEFTSYLAIASNAPATFCFILNIFIAKYIPANRRMISSLAITLLFFGSQTALVKIDTDSWQLTFFRITMLTCVLMNSFASLFQCGLFSIIGKFPHEYTTATMSGQALGGIFAAIANIISTLLAADQTTSAFIYFLLGSTSLLTSFLIVTFLLPNLLFYKFHAEEKSIYRWIDVNNCPTSALIQPESLLTPIRGHWSLFKIVWIETLVACLTFLVTMIGLPALLVLIVSVYVPSSWNDKYCVAVVGFLVFAIGDYLGRILSGIIRWPKANSWWTLGIAICRIGCVLLLMLCNLHPRQHLPVVFESDVLFGVFSFIFGLGNGYLCNLVFVNAPQLVESDEQESANGIVTMGLGIGLSSGVILSYFVLMAL